LKYLIIASLIALFFLLVYSRLRPYLDFLRKVVSFINSGPADWNAQSGPSSRNLENKLVRCVGCGTWVPADRMVGVGALRNYCSHDCLEKKAAPRRKMAG
jgi:hypothetical protein